MPADTYRTLADLVLVTHAAFVVFVVLGLLLILGGGFAGWCWIRNPWFRATHLAAIALVAGQAWLGVICPLTNLEMTLREKAGQPAYEGSFLAHWLQRLLYYDAPSLVFVVCYSLFGLVVLATWRLFPPRPFRTAPGS